MSGVGKVPIKLILRALFPFSMGYIVEFLRARFKLCFCVVVCPDNSRLFLAERWLMC
jgi:hypothetical protein